MLTITRLSKKTLYFPDPATALADPQGLLAIGGDLSCARLLTAYHQGIFPWFSAGETIMWWSPDPRAVLLPGQFHCSRSLRRFHRHSPYRVTLNHAFADVVQGCASQRKEGTWITQEVQDAWIRLHLLGEAHSVEVWQQAQLVGGMYGLSMGKLFSGESMFSRADHASKIALLLFCQYFLDNGGRLIDCQILNPHTQSLGAVNLPRRDFLQQLSTLRLQTLAPGCWGKKTLF